MTTTGHWFGPCLLSLLVFATACPEEVKPPAESETSDETMSTGSSSGSGGGPAQCPDNPDPECTTANACGNNEICVACECVPQPEDCSDPLTANCIEDEDCGDGRVCVACQCFDDESGTTADVLDTTGDYCSVLSGDECESAADCSANEECMSCTCVSNCECSLLDNPCADPGLSCDGCNCVACGSGEASPVIQSIDQETPEIVVQGTMLSANVTGEMGECPDSLCVVEITNNFPFEVFFNAVNSPVLDPVYLSPDEGMLPASSTTILELRSDVCDMPGTVMDTIFFQNPIELNEYGRVDITIELTLPGA